jgi:hypothetical protein
MYSMPQRRVSRLRYPIKHSYRYVAVSLLQNPDTTTVSMQLQCESDETCRRLHDEKPIHPWARCPLVSATVPTICLHSRLSYARMLAVCTSVWQHSLTSSSHSLLGLPWTPVLSMMPNVICLVSLVLLIRQMCREKFKFLSIAVRRMTNNANNN